MGRRLEGTHLAGLWEFPGGKVHHGETHEAALQREIDEELGTNLTGVRHIFSATHTYPDRTVELHFFRGALAREPVARLGQQLRWVAREEFESLSFPAADAELIDGLLHARL